MWVALGEQVSVVKTRDMYICSQYFANKPMRASKRHNQSCGVRFPADCGRLHVAEGDEPAVILCNASGVSSAPCLTTSTTEMSAEPPPTYSQDDLSDVDSETHAHEPQILIVPPPGGVSFQKGFLGADGERAAIEGEVLIKGMTHGQWKRVYVYIYALPSV